MRQGIRIAAPHRMVVLGIVLCVMVVAIALAGGELHRHLSGLEAAIAHQGAWGLLLFIAVYVVTTSLLIPESLLAAMAGAVLGFWPGLFASMAGALLAAALQYAISRSVLRQPVLRFVAQRPKWQALRIAVGRDERRLQWLLRLAPVNAALISYLLGAIGVRFAQFMLACAALLVHLLMEVYAGAAAKHFIHDAGDATSAHPLHDVLLVAGLLVAALILHQVARLARKAMAASQALPESQPPATRDHAG